MCLFVCVRACVCVCVCVRGMQGEWGGKRAVGLSEGMCVRKWELDVQQ